MSKTETRAVVVSAGSVKTSQGVKKQGTALNLPDVEARKLIRDGLVRAAQATAEAQTEKGGK